MHPTQKWFANNADYRYHVVQLYLDETRLLTTEQIAAHISKHEGRVVNRHTIQAILREELSPAKYSRLKGLRYTANRQRIRERNDAILTEEYKLYPVNKKGRSAPCDNDLPASAPGSVMEPISWTPTIPDTHAPEPELDYTKLLQEIKASAPDNKPHCPFCGKIWEGPLPCGHCGEPDIPDPDDLPLTLKWQELPTIPEPPANTPSEPVPPIPVDTAPNDAAPLSSPDPWKPTRPI